MGGSMAGGRKTGKSQGLADTATGHTCVAEQPGRLALPAPTRVRPGPPGRDPAASGGRARRGRWTPTFPARDAGRGAHQGGLRCLRGSRAGWSLSARRGHQRTEKACKACAIVGPGVEKGMAGCGRRLPVWTGAPGLCGSGGNNPLDCILQGTGSSKGFLSMSSNENRVQGHRWTSEGQEGGSAHL